MSAESDLTYTINERDEIVSVGENWAGFALANDAADLAPENVVGRSLWEFVEDLATVHVYREILRRARAGHPASFAFRCDSPASRRFMEMRVTGGEAGAVVFETREVRAEMRPPQKLLERFSRRADELVRACGWCRRVDVAGAWEEVEEAVRRLGLFEREELPRLTHGMCERCHVAISQQLAGMRSRP